MGANSSDKIQEEQTYDEKSMSESRACCSWLRKLSDWDHELSWLIQSNNNTWIEAIFFCLPAHLFNRSIILAPMGIITILGGIYHDEMLVVNGF